MNTKTIKFIAVMSLLACGNGIFSAYAGEGHGHGEGAPSASGNAPKRQPDGSVFLPKLSQRHLSVRTVVAETTNLAQTVELTGRVVMDPNAGGQVQAMQAGRIEGGPKGLPTLGQRVQKGELLAVVRASASAIDRSNQQAQVAELRANLALAKKRLDRLNQLEGTVPQKEIEAAQSEIGSLAARLAVVSPSVAATEALTAPVSGVIAATRLVAGQVVDAREVLFEIIDPSRLRIEASAFDASLLPLVASASVMPAPGVSIALQFVGAGRSLVDGAIPLQFRTTGSEALPLAVNQAVKVLVHTKTLVKGVAVPAAALVKSPSNQDQVWVHTGPEQFVPRTVRVLPLDGAHVSVQDSLKPGDRVVTQGAPLVNQVR